MNNQPKKGILIIVSGPSGVGKDTIVNQFLEQRDDCTVSISATTRQPRKGEVDGVNYHFVTEEQFQEYIDQDLMLEYALYNENYYGTPAKAVDDLLNMGKHVILVIEIQGAQKIRKIRPDAVFVFMMPPSMDCLYSRLVGRGTDTKEAIAARLAAAYEEMDVGKGYDFVIVNDDIHDTVHLLDCIVTAAECMPKYDPNLLKGVSSFDA